jgi:Fe2+ transport system protein FeoA
MNSTQDLDGESSRVPCDARPANAGDRGQAARVPLALLAPGEEATVDELAAAIDPVQREQLAAYGLAPGRRLRVLQHRPLTVVQVEHTELALEAAVAREIWIEVDPGRTASRSR